MLFCVTIFLLRGLTFTLALNLNLHRILNLVLLSFIIEESQVSPYQPRESTDEAKDSTVHAVQR